MVWIILISLMKMSWCGFSLVSNSSAGLPRWVDGDASSNSPLAAADAAAFDLAPAIGTRRHASRARPAARPAPGHASTSPIPS